MLTTIRTLLILCISFNLAAQESPFGTGQINNQNIGLLEDASVVVPSQSGYGFIDFFPDAQEILQDYSFDIYVPESYDGTEPYGLVTFINSGNNGGFKSQWLSVLDDKKLIWIAGDNIGNPININIRMGTGMAAALRMQELFNIDTDRIYTSGNSGGARMAHNLAFIYPETFRGAMPSCGGSYIRQVEQDYETQNPNSHYEAILPYPADYLEYLIPFDQRFANMTSFDDFREGDIMNIYHNGSEQDGFKGKFLETSGGHCSTSTEHFTDAINFVEHPFIEVIQEEFDDAEENSFNALNTVEGIDSNIELAHGNSEVAQIQSKDLFLWDDAKGAIFETSIMLDSIDYNMNTSFNLGIWSMEDPLNYCGLIGDELVNDIPNILLTIDFDNAQPSISVSIDNPSQPDMGLLLTSTFLDWDVNQPLPIKYHLWGKELRIELGAHVDPIVTNVDGVKLLDDSRSMRIRWDEIANGFWEDAIWQDGAFLTLSSQKIDETQSASNLSINRVELLVADIDITTQIPLSTTDIYVEMCQGSIYEFGNELLTDSGVYNMTLVDSQECVTTINLDLTVIPLPIVNIVEVDGEITADAGFQSYQWYYNGIAIEDETNAVLDSIQNGDYYVLVVDDNGCENVSEVINYLNTSIDNDILHDVSVFPNPTSSSLYIEADVSTFEAELFDIMGRRLITNMNTSNDVSNLANGTYILIVRSEEDAKVLKIHKRN